MLFRKGGNNQMKLGKGGYQPDSCKFHENEFNRLPVERKNKIRLRVIPTNRQTDIEIQVTSDSLGY